MFDPARDGKRLRQACKNSLKDMEASRKNYKEYLRELAGPRYSQSSVLDSYKERYINLIELAATTYKQNLIGNVPQINVTPRDPDLSPDAYSFERAVNQLLDTEDVQPELEMTILNAMFSPFGALKLSLDASKVADIEGMRVPTGPPLLQAIMFDDLVIDMAAKSPKLLSFIGNRYQITVEAALEAGYDPEVVATLWRTYQDSDGKSDGAQSLSRRGRSPKEEDFQNLIELWDVWVPSESIVVTYGGRDFEEAKILKVTNWTGPKAGPFHLVWFEPIPGNALPSAPVGFWIDLHELVNTLWKKLAEQAERQKSLGAVGSANEQDGNTIRDAGDGDIVTLNEVNGFTKIDNGGISQQNFVFADAARMRFNDQAGNIFLLGGLSPSTGTVGQDKLLSEGASQRLRMMQARVYDFIRRVLRDYGEYVATDPLMEVPILKHVPNTDITIPSVWTSDQMRGEYYHYILDVQPHSMQQKSPEERLARVQDTWRQDIAPMAQILMSEGKIPNFENYYKLIADLAGQPEINTLITYTQGQMEPGTDGGPAMPQNTTRNYNTGSGGGGKSPDADIMAQMAAAGRDNNASGGGM